MPRFLVFDLDGTLLDSDEALVAPFLALGVARERISFGHVVAEECERLGVAVTDYLAGYDVDAAQPFDGVDDLVRQLDRWAVCSNNRGPVGRAELARLRWEPEVALFSDAFTGSKELGPVLAALGLHADDIVFVGDSEHDRACATAAGCTFVLAGWNPRALAIAEPSDVVVRHPSELLDVVKDRT